ncbi:MAG TPA: hypothetical protein VF509_02380 [Sphingobium sp.]
MRLKTPTVSPEPIHPALRHWLLSVAIVSIIFLLGPIAVGMLRS